MINLKKTIIVLCTSLSCNILYAQHTIKDVDALQSVPNVYNAKKINHKIETDGHLETTWDKAAWSSEFIDIEGYQKPIPKYNTKFKMLWDNEYLYIYAQLEEPHVWGTIHQKDAIIYHDNDFEVFIKPNTNSAIYYEIEINALNTIMDLMIPKPYRFGGQAIMHWDTKNIKSAIYTSGTINNPKDVDNYWAVEMAIPFSSLANFGNKNTPKINDYWRMNFSRVQWQHEISQDKYTRKKHNNKILDEDNWVWSPIGLINMHYPERWGYIQFVTDEESNTLPQSYYIEKMAWNIFYLQQIHKNKYQRYTSDISQLEGYDKFLKDDLRKYEFQITLSLDRKFYHLNLKDKSEKQVFTIDSYGNYTNQDEQ